jgi:hypothetical protein
LIWQAIQRRNFRRLGDVISTDFATYVSGALGVLLALGVSILAYGFLSGWGKVYDVASGLKIGQNKFREYGSFSIFTEPGGRLKGDAVTVYFENAPLVTIRLREDSKDGLELNWNYQYSLWDKIDIAEGALRRTGIRQLIVSEPSYLYIPLVRNMTLEIPSGTLTPLVKSILDYAERRAEVKFDPDEARAVTDIVANYLIDEAGLGIAYNKVLNASLWSGDVQFLTLFCFVLCVTLMFLSIFSTRVGDFSFFLMETLPYLGFFGTLVGMAQALKILGTANLSDSLQKTISLGPIGSQMGLAIETTKFALIFYLVAGFILHLQKIATRWLRKAAGT